MRVKNGIKMVICFGVALVMGPTIGAVVGALVGFGASIFFSFFGAIVRAGHFGGFAAMGFVFYGALLGGVLGLITAIVFVCAGPAKFLKLFR